MTTTTKRNGFDARASDGFTLIELLVVIGLIAVLAGGIGLSLGKGNSGNSLQNAQATLASALSGARAQSALNQTRAALFVNAAPNSENFMREFRIAVETSPNNWQARGDPIILPSGIYLVPKEGVFNSPGEVSFVGTWKSGTAWTLYSTAYDQTNVQKLKDKADSNLSLEDYHEIASFSISGTTTAGQMVFSPAEVQADLSLKFDKPELVRGANISQYGVSSLVNEAESFK
jgi:prepilin-type N-terminal cleavage/methylation domain-containing protein